MVNPFLAANRDRAKQLEAQHQGPHRFGCAKELRFDDWPAVAFDLDHAIARYRMEEMHRLIYDLVVAQLSRDEYAGIEFRTFGELDMKFAQRGIFYDKQRGVVMKLDGNGDIAQAYHGTTRMEKEEIDDIYAGCTQLITLKHGPFIKPEEDPITKPIIHCFDDQFTISTIYLLMELVQLCLDGKKIHLGFERPFRFLMEAYERIFDPKDFVEERIGFFSALKNDPTRYLARLSYGFIKFLKKLRQNKIATIVITNSAPDFANFILNYSIGERWRAVIDAVIYDAKRPYFFSFGPRKFYWVDYETGNIGGEANPRDFTVPVYASQGTMSEMKHVVRAVNTHLTQRMVYVGHKLVREIYACSIIGNCGIFAVTPELGKEDETVWGPMLGTTENPSFWRKKLEKWSRALIGSVEDLSGISPTRILALSTPTFQVVNRD